MERKLDFEAIAANAAEDLLGRMKANSDMDMADAIFEIADSFVPVYNGDVMDVIHSYPDLWHRDPECGFTGPTIVDFARTVIFDALIEHLWTVYNNAVDKEDENVPA